MTANFSERIYAKLLANPDDALIIWPEPAGAGRSHTGRTLLNRMSAIRNELTAEKLQPGQRVMMLLPVSVDLICTIVAVMAMGAIPVLPPAGPSLRTLSLLIKGNNGAVITQRRLAAPLAWLINRFGIVPCFVDGMPASAPTWSPPVPVDPDQPALVSHSSGSTGAPKAIRRSHRVLLAQHQALRDAFPPWPGQRDFPLFPTILLHNLACGTVSILPDLPQFTVTRMDPARLVRQLVEQQVQTLTGNVYYFRQLLHYLDTRPLTFPDVRAVGIGGSPVPEWLVQSLRTCFVRADIYVIYGSSEAEPIAIRTVGPDPYPPRAGYAVGMVHPSLQVRIRPGGTPPGGTPPGGTPPGGTPPGGTPPGGTPPGETLTFPDGRSYAVGEIEVKGAHVATAENDWLQTGDFGYFDESNQLFLTGRIGNEQLHRGVQHYQIEHVLHHLNGVVRVAALSTKTGFSVYVEGTPAESDLRRALSAAFPEGIVDHIQFRKNLPVDARHHSKIRYDRVK